MASHTSKDRRWIASTIYPTRSWTAATIATFGPGIELEETGTRIVALVLTGIGLSIVRYTCRHDSAFFVETSAR